MTNKTNAQITEFFNSLNAQLDHLQINDFIQSDDELEAVAYSSDPFLHISEVLSENNAFNVEIIYYHNAIKYLAEHDCSLETSVGLALEIGYDLKSINSELLASLLASQESREQFDALQSEIEAFFAE